MWLMSKWELHEAEYVGHRLVLAILKHASGLKVRVLAGHFHHHALERKAEVRGQARNGLKCAGDHVM